MTGLKNAAQRFRDYWDKQSSKERANIIKMCLSIGLVTVLIGFYYLRDSGGSKPVREAVTPKEEIVPAKYLDRDIDARIEALVKLEVQRKLAEGQISTNTSDEQANSSNDELEDLQFMQDTSSDPQYTPSPDQLSYPDPMIIPQHSGNAGVAYIGGINSKQVYSQPERASISESNDKAGRIPVPPGFMPAKMLVGVMAQVSNSGSADPKPIHLRVQAPATLPNKIKMNLAGCFVIANTWGNLGSERIEAETVSLTCMTSDKKTIITGAIKGYLADKDGQRDISGRVVTKAGALLGRQFAADFLAGSGNAISQNTGNVAVSPLGSVTSLTGSEIAQRGAASGLAGGFNHAAEFISELIAQSGPVLESGAARDVMIMVQEMAWLTIEHIDDTSQSAVALN